MDLWIGAVIAVATGTVTYAAQKWIDRRSDRANAGPIEVIRRLYTERFDALRSLEGSIAEMEHCIEHLEQGDVEYLERGRDFARRIRIDSRAAITVLGEELIAALKAETDVALAFFESAEAGAATTAPAEYGAAQTARRRAMYEVERTLDFPTCKPHG